MEPTSEEIGIFDDAGRLGDVLWERSAGVEARSLDPIITSTLLYRRLRSNFRGFRSLWAERLDLEGAILLRSALEAAICLVANHTMRERFVILMRCDAAATAKGQAKVLREAGDDARADLAKRTLDGIVAQLPEGATVAPLNWKALAAEGRSPQLYEYHKWFSGLSTHVTGLSILRGLTRDNLDVGNAELDGVERRGHFNLMSTAMLQGSTFHARMIEDDKSYNEAAALSVRLAMTSLDWKPSTAT